MPKAQAKIREFGGKYIGGGFNKAIGSAGAPPPNRVILLQFPDMDTVKAFEEKDAMGQAARQRLAVSTPASACSGLRASSRSDNAEGGGL